MTDVQFGKLEDLPLREAWSHEAHSFTPWLAENIEHLSEAIGIPLELSGTEVAVEEFSADILASDPRDGTKVLIENQLENTDHRHLGQILTYLAGLEAQVVIWIAPSFREAHRSAIRWLNTHTEDDFSFFAVRLRVVRIGESPFAPIFEVVEKPNDWDREIKRKTASETTAQDNEKREFWREFLARVPALAKEGIKPTKYSNIYIVAHEEPHIDISVYIGKSSSGIYVRSGWGQPAEPVSGLLEPYREQLEEKLGTDLGPSGKGGHFLIRSLPKGHDHRDSWDEIISWMEEQISVYRTLLSPILSGRA